ncbi:MAG: cupin domain-containing protein [Gemmiger sp.]|nr:cupin domain-containing protein [Gemmiger sp.]
MVHKHDELSPSIVHNMRGGTGDVALTRLFQPEEYESPLPMVARLRLPPGASIGYHQHEGEEEIITVISGVADYSDDGGTITLHAGDCCLCKSGHSHSICNAIETDDLQLFAVVAAVAGK